MKHAILLALIQAVRAKGAVRVVETHAGAGLYDLHGEAASRSSEAEGGVGRLMAAKGELSAPLGALTAAVQAANPDGALRFYPGSPSVALGAMLPGDSYLGYELRPDDFASLQAVISAPGQCGQNAGIGQSNESTSRRAESRFLAAPVTVLHVLHPAKGGAKLDSRDRKAGIRLSRKSSFPGTDVPGLRPPQREAARATAMQADGYAALGEVIHGGELVLIDPPFERSDDYDRAAEAVALCLARQASVAVWVPIKDLETLDAFVRRIEALSPPSLVVAEVRLRALVNPMKMNGCAMVLVGTPDIDEAAAEVCSWVALACGDAGARGGVERIEP